MPKGKVEDPITDQEIAFAHLVMAGAMNDREAAAAAGISAASAAYVKSKPRVKAYMEQHRSSVRTALAQHEANKLSQFNVSREEILAKYWEFACIPPKLTNHNTTSQTKALDSIRDMLGYAAPPHSKDSSLTEDPDGSKCQIYHPSWLIRRQQGFLDEPNPEDEGPETVPEAAQPDPPRRTSYALRRE